jgi:hypothetical protein
MDYAKFDPEVVPLCQAMNALPGIKTTESCCGHGKEPFRIWFKVDEGDHRGLFVLTRSVDRRYFEYGFEWDIVLSVSDAPKHPLPINFVLESKEQGSTAYLQAQALVDNINLHRRHKNFLKGYGLEELELELGGDDRVYDLREQFNKGRNYFPKTAWPLK